MNVRRATGTDHGTVAAIQVRSWQWAYRGLIPDVALETLTFAEREPGWQTALGPGSAHRVWLAENDREPVGFAAWGPARDADARGVGAAELYAIYLERTAAGTGVAAALLRAVRGEMLEQGHARAVLWVLAANPRARRFYERSGWTRDGRSKVVNLRGVELDAVRYETALR